MLKSVYRNKSLVLILLLAIFIKAFSTNELWVERYYTYGIYPVISKCLRLLFGWIPFSAGDILYSIFIIYISIKVWKFIGLVRKSQLNKSILFAAAKKVFRIALIIYVLFNLLWGLNYNRSGITEQLQLSIQKYSLADLNTLTNILQERLNFFAARVKPADREHLNNNKKLFQEGVASYQIVKDTFPFLHYSYPSVKPSMFSHIGQYFGFTGYYNPFSGEAQLKTTIPFFLKSFIVHHEIAHQLGYGKENEANFVAFLTGKQSKSNEVLYSIYFEMYLYAFSDLSKKDSSSALSLKQKWHPQVQQDYGEFIDYLKRSKNFIEPFVSRFYDQFLKWNRQPKGKLTYNEVIVWLIAYMKKFGVNKL